MSETASCGFSLDGVNMERVRHSPRRVAEILAAAGGEVVTRREIYDALYGARGNGPGGRTLDVFVCRLRRALRGSPWIVANVWGVGWRLVRVSK